MKPLLLLMGCILISLTGKSQTCIGGVNYSSATFWNPAWIGGCTNGTACTGSPVTMDTRPSACPSINKTGLDPCAPAPACSGSNITAADLWYKFYACGTTATIHVIQYVSFVATIQAFSNSSSTCSGLTEIGCAIAGGPSGGVTLNITGLTPGNLYYFRVFGTASTLAQTSGAWCFCGSVGLCPAPVLPVKLLAFTIRPELHENRLQWRAADQEHFDRFEIERSTNGIDYIKIGQVQATQSSFPQTEYTYTDHKPTQTCYYRLKMIDDNGYFDYSTVIKSTINRREFFAYYDHNQNTLAVHAGSEGYISVQSVSGMLVHRTYVKAGKSNLQLALAPGFYLVSDSKGTVRKIISYPN